MSEPIVRAAQLVALGLDPTARPASDPEYTELVELFRDNPSFRANVNRIADGLGLHVLDATPTAGMLLGAAADSPLAVSRADLQDRLGWTSAKERMIYGVAFAGAAAWCFPNSQSVADSVSRPVHAQNVDRLIREHAKAVAAGETALEDELSDAWQAYAAHKEIDLYQDRSALKRGCTVKMCDLVLSALASYGMLAPARVDDPPPYNLKVWRPTHRFRAHVARTGGPLAWQTLAHSPVPDRVHAQQGGEQEDDR